MSYAIRNTLILLLVLLMMAGAGWSYLHFVQQDKITKLETTLDQKQKTLRQKQAIASQYDAVINKFGKAQYYMKNLDKSLLQTQNPDKVFDYLNNVSGGAPVEFDFTYSDSTANAQYGILRSEIKGGGYYKSVINFIKSIELSRPLNKVKSLTISPRGDVEQLSEVDFNFTLESYYDKAKIFDNPSMKIIRPDKQVVYNAFYPHIHEPIPNKDGLVNVEQSKLIGVSPSAVFIVDQNGHMKTIRPGGKVYLGTLKNINAKKGSAVFELNKGGIVEQITLEVQG